MRLSRVALALASAACFAAGLLTASPAIPEPLASAKATMACLAGYSLVDGVGCARRLADGLWSVVLDDGFEITTHGPDAAGQPGETAEAHAPERQPACSNDYRTVALYAWRDADNYAAKRAAILHEIKTTNHFLNGESVEAGNVTADMRVRCDAAGEIWVGKFRFSGTTYQEIAAAARSAGFTSASEKYLIYADGYGPCGMAGPINRDSRPGPENANNVGPDYAVQKCWSVDLHEWGHMVGAVQLDAPGSDGSWHCNDGRSTMCGSGSVCSVTHFDCRHDSYFDPATEPGEYLETHWNLGKASRWIRFGGGSTTPPPPPPPTAKPGAPSSLRAAGSPTTLSWARPTSGGAPAGYHVYECAGGSSSFLLWSTSCTPNTRVASVATTAYPTGRTGKYCWEVSAYNAAGEGPRSNRVCT